MQQVLGVLSVLVPILYQKFFINLDYVYMYYTAQTIYVVADSINLFAATRYNLYLGIPDPILYLIGGKIAQMFEMGFTFFISLLIFSKIIPPGTESTLQSLCMTVFFFGFIMRSFIGVSINQTFFQVRSADMSGYVYLRIISLITSCIPMLYLWWVVPTRQRVSAVQQKFIEQSKTARDEAPGVHAINSDDSAVTSSGKQNGFNDDYKKTEI